MKLSSWANNSLSRMYEQAKRLTLQDSHRVLVISDLHIGDGSPNDDMRHNMPLLLESLKYYYLPRGYTLILNGDIEEYLRSRPDDIRKAWPQFFELLAEFRRQNRLIRLIGNHELQAQGQPFPDGAHFDGEALRLEYKGDTMLIFHGHQSARFNSGRFNGLIGGLLRIFANSLRIGNYSVSQDSRKKLTVEKTVYEFSRRHRILSMIGHTHRPLFESLSRKESWNFWIERLCRLFPGASASRKEKIREMVAEHTNRYHEKEVRGEGGLADMVYGDILTPCLFNSGCGIGKGGLTGIEIKKGRVYLVFWTDTEREARYQEYELYKNPLKVGKTSLRYVLRREELDYLFARINLLSGDAFATLDENQREP